MKEGKQYSFWKLITSGEENNAILIPQIQRDYVQYRTGKVETNLVRFINNLVSAITAENKPINLNFVYGNATKKYDSQKVIDAFTPIDGQQRLTTLFLLHYYIFNEAESPFKNDLIKHFYYETRITTQEFMDLLVEKNDKKFYNNDKLPSEVVRDASWYSSLWEFDPSVCSCLKVLDQINKTFESLEKEINWKALTKSLTSEHCPITFMKLEIEGIDKPNELYIKMNSRGKQLTAFENFKTELYGYIKEHPTSFSASFKQNMDGDWLNFLWELCKELNEEVCENYTDVFYRELLHYIIVNRICCHRKADDIKGELKDLINTDMPEKFYLSDYKEGLDKDNNKLITAIQDIFYTLNLLSSLDEESRTIVTKEIFGLQYEKNVFGCNLSQYMQRTLLFAVTKYAVAAQSEDEVELSKFMEWWRVAKNLITNSQIDSLKTYLDAISALNNFQHVINIVDYLIGQNEDDNNLKFIDLPALDIEQCREEILKQKIITMSSVLGWRDAIYHAEEQRYFNGEILFALKLAGVHRGTDANQDNLNLFEENWLKINEIFSESRDDNGIHRVLLVYGDYSKKMSKYADDNYLLSYYFNDIKHHKQDWRGLLREADALKMFGNMLNEFKASNQTFSKFVRTKCNEIKAVNDIVDAMGKEELHFFLIKEPKIFEYIKSFGRCWYCRDEIYLLRTSTRGSFIHYKLYVVYLKLLNAGKEINFYEGKGSGKGNDRDSIYVNGEHYFYESKEFYVDDKDGKKIVAKSIDEMVKMLK